MDIRNIILGKKKFLNNLQDILLVGQLRPWKKGGVRKKKKSNYFLLRIWFEIKKKFIQHLSHSLISLQSEIFLHDEKQFFSYIFLQIKPEKVLNFLFLFLFLHFPPQFKQTIGEMDTVEEKSTAPNTGLIQSKPSKIHVLDIKSTELNWVISLHDKGGENAVR